MKIEKNVDGTNTSFALEGRLDTMTAPLLESEIQGKLDGVTDFDKPRYCSHIRMKSYFVYLFWLQRYEF